VKNWKERISIDPKVCHGKPCVKGTRVWVSLIVDNLASGASEDEILEVLEKNPDGITLTEMGYAMGVPFQKLAGPTKGLIDEGKVRKEKKLYFLA